MAMTREQAALADRLRLLDGASAMEAAVVVELAAWEHELRGPGGQWTRSPESVSKDISRSLGISLKQKSVASMADIKAEHAKHVADVARVQEEHKKDMTKLVTDLQQKASAAEAEEHKKRKMVLAWHVGTILAGGVLGIVEAKLGVPDIAVLGSAVGPAVGQEVIDFWKRLS